MTYSLSSFVRFGAAVALPAWLLCACSAPIECKTEITDGSTSFKGAATGKAEDSNLRAASVRDACTQRCAAQKATLLDACTAACVTDVGAQKLGARTTCGRK